MLTKDKDGQKFINIRPIAIAALALIAGIHTAYYRYTEGVWIIFFIPVVLLCALLVLVFPLKVNRKRALAWAVAVAVIFSLGFATVSLRVLLAKTAYDHGGEVTFVGRVKQVADIGNGMIYVNFDDCNVQGDDVRGDASFTVNKLALDRMPKLGDVITCYARISNRCVNGRIDGDTIAGLYYDLTDVSNLRIKEEGVLNAFEFICAKVEGFLLDNLSEETAPVAIALLVGNTSYIPIEQISAYRMAGIAHVFAVSGLHVGLFVGIFAFLARIFKMGRWRSALFILIPTFLYCAVCAFRPSSLRAFVMAALSITATRIGFKRDSLSFASAAAILILLVSPMGLYDVGFKLSFLSVTSISVIYPLLSRIFKPLKQVGSSVALSASAQLATMPVLTNMSGYISVIAVFANLVFLPLITLLYFFTVFCAVIGCVELMITGQAEVSMLVPQALIVFITKAVNTVNYSYLVLPASFSVMGTVTWYAGLAVVSDGVNLSGRVKALLFSLCAACSLVLAIV